MRLNLFQNITKEIRKIDVSEFIKEIGERLEKMEEELVIDRFEGKIAVCEERSTGKIKKIEKKNLPEGIKEGSIIKQENGKYIEAKEEQEIIENRIEDKMNKIWKN